MNNSKKLLQTNGLSPTLFPMRKKLGLAIIAAIAFFATVCVPSARADEKLTPDQTALSPTTLSGGDIPNPIDYSDPSADNSIVVAPSTFSASFSPEPVPEPSTIGLFATGILACLMVVGTRRHSSHKNRQSVMP